MADVVQMCYHTQHTKQYDTRIMYGAKNFDKLHLSLEKIFGMSYQFIERA